MANGVLGLGSGAASLNNELIEKLKEADRASSVAPIETSIENIKGEGGESEKIQEIKAKVAELLASVKPLDLFVSGGVNVFEQKVATVNGTAVIFDAEDIGKLNLGTTSVNITSLAQRDVFQSAKFSDKEAMILGSNVAADTLVINHDGVDFTFETNGKTYDELTKEINNNPNFVSSIEEVNTNEFRLVIKSKEPGVANALTITQNGTLDLGLGSNSGKVLSAKNMEATVDGVAYSVSSNSIVVDGGLKITATEIGDASITVQKDDSTIETIMNDFVSKYNELASLVENEIFSAESKINDKASLRSMMDGIKEKLFASYGVGDDLNIFNAGFEIDKSGNISIDSKKFNEFMKSNPEDMKMLFLGVAEDKGLGTQIKEYIDDIGSFNGLLTTYENNMNSRKESLEKEKTKAIETLDNKYSMLSQQFAAYNTIINRFESQFAGLKLMIDQSVAGN